MSDDDAAVLEAWTKSFQQNYETTSDRLKQDKTFILAFIKSTPRPDLFSLGVFPESIRDDEEIVWAACERSWYNYRFASDRLRGNTKLLIAYVEHGENDNQHLGEVNKAYVQWGFQNVIRDMVPPLALRDPEVVEAITKRDPNKLLYLQRVENGDFVLSKEQWLRATRHPDFDPDFISTAGMETGGCYSLKPIKKTAQAFLASDIWNDVEWLEACLLKPKSASIIDKVPDELKSHPSIVRALVSKGMKLEDYKKHYPLVENAEELYNKASVLDLEDVLKMVSASKANMMKVPHDFLQHAEVIRALGLDRAKYPEEMWGKYDLDQPDSYNCYLILSPEGSARQHTYDADHDQDYSYSQEIKGTWGYDSAEKQVKLHWTWEYVERNSDRKTNTIDRTVAMGVDGDKVGSYKKSLCKEWF
eukprot:TRINITY_DN15518_c0_g1_i2.p1 TRINITY_DN15518_c0_g1~~TRINITY_DN15518_c0_g1_i2.p1  ORF type:complete len:417 (+),score=58.28 TRINITY_DN15518_c0_g1_i2:95-1345(+)